MNSKFCLLPETREREKGKKKKEKNATLDSAENAESKQVHYTTAASSEIDWSILLDAAPQEYYLTETISHSVMAIVATSIW